MSGDNNILIPRGEMFVTRPGMSGERSFGNTPEFTFTVESEVVDHMDMRRKQKFIDRSVTISTEFSASLTADHVSDENMSIFFNGASGAIVQAAAAGVSETFTVSQGMVYQLGSSVNVSGVRDISAVIVTVDDVAQTLGADYMVYPELGRISVLVGGGIEDGDEVTIGYSVDEASRDQTVSGFEVYSCSIRWISDNAGGLNRDFFIPNAELSSSGDLQLVSDEFQQVAFNVKALRKGGLEAIYADGRAV